MSMKIKVSINKSTGETVVNYLKTQDNAAFRYKLLKRIIDHTDQSITVVIDTNQQVKELSFKTVETLLDRAGVSYCVWHVKANAGFLLGIKKDFIKPQKKKNERLYVIDLSPRQFSKELFEGVFAHFDLALMFGNRDVYAKLCDVLRYEPLEDIIFNSNCFTAYIYDSAVCASIRSSFDIAKYVKE